MLVLGNGRALMSGGKVSQRTAGNPSRKSVPETSGGAGPEPSLKRDGWMSCWKNRQKKWSKRGVFSTSQNALQRQRERINQYTGETTQVHKTSLSLTGFENQGQAQQSSYIQFSGKIKVKKKPYADHSHSCSD